jgi:DNA-binding beta-propeller fold protein YncE
MRPAIISLLVAVVFVAACSSAPRGACNPDPPRGAVGSICGFANPEDVEVVQPAALLLVSEMRRGGTGGAIAALPLDPSAQRGASPRRLWPTRDGGRDVGSTALVGDPSCTRPPLADGFAPHGITSAATQTPGVTRIAVVGHGVREAIELFDLTGAGDGATLSWRGCVPLPPHTVGNDVSIPHDGEIVVSNYMPAMEGWSGLYYTLKGGFGANTGDVMAWRSGRGWRHLRGTASQCPNGVLVSPDGSSVFYAETGSGKVSRVPRAGTAAGEAPAQVSIGGNPDNLSVSPRGTILAATHTDGAAFLLCAFGRHPCRTGWSIFEIDPTSLHATLLLHHDGSVVGAVASAAEFNGRVYFGAVFDERIGVWRP